MDFTSLNPLSLIEKYCSAAQTYKIQHNCKACLEFNGTVISNTYWPNIPQHQTNLAIPTQSIVSKSQRLMHVLKLILRKDLKLKTTTESSQIIYKHFRRHLNTQTIHSSISNIYSSKHYKVE